MVNGKQFAFVECGEGVLVQMRISVFSIFGAKNIAFRSPFWVMLSLVCSQFNETG